MKVICSVADMVRLSQAFSLVGASVAATIKVFLLANSAPENYGGGVIVDVHFVLSFIFSFLVCMSLCATCFGIMLMIQALGGNEPGIGMLGAISATVGAAGLFNMIIDQRSLFYGTEGLHGVFINIGVTVIAALLLGGATEYFAGMKHKARKTTPG